jgi:hypothetical protein
MKSLETIQTNQFLYHQQKQTLFKLMIAQLALAVGINADALLVAQQDVVIV